jgi:hypothetical protein
MPRRRIRPQPGDTLDLSVHAEHTVLTVVVRASKGWAELIEVERVDEIGVTRVGLIATMPTGYWYWVRPLDADDSEEGRDPLT